MGMTPKLLGVAIILAARVNNDTRLALGDTALFKKNEYFVWMNILDFFKMNNVLNKYFGSSLPASEMVVPKCLKLIWNHSWIISGTYFSPFQGSITYTGASGGLRKHILASFGNFK